MIGKLDSEIIEKFIEFQEKTGKHRDLCIEDVEFEESDIFNDLDNVELIGSRKIGSHDDLEKINDKNGIPVYDASNNVLTHIDEEKFPNEVFLVKNNANPDISFASEGNSSAGTNFIIHKDKYYVNNHRTVMKFSNKYFSKYVYYNIIDMKKRYGFKRGYIPSQTELRKLVIKIPIPKDLNKFYSSYQIQEAIVEFLEYSFDNIERIRQRIDERYSIFKRLKKALIPSTFIKDYIKVAFGRYAKEKGIEFDITDVEFYEKKIGEFINPKGGSNAYNKTYINNNKGAYPLYTGAKDIVALVKEINSSDIITAESVSYNKDNDAGSRAFYHKEPYIIGGHHYSLTIKKEYQNEILTKYFYYCMENIFSRNKFYQSKKPVANIGLIKEFPIFIPRDLQDYTSLEIQKIIADFIEYTEDRLQKEFDRMDTAYHNLDRLYNTYLGRTFRLIDWGGKS